MSVDVLKLRHDLATQCGVELTPEQAQECVRDVQVLTATVEGQDFTWLREAAKSPGRLLIAWYKTESIIGKFLRYDDFILVRDLLLMVDDRVNKKGG